MSTKNYNGLYGNQTRQKSSSRNSKHTNAIWKVQGLVNLRHPSTLPRMVQAERGISQRKTWGPHAECVGNKNK